MSYETSLIELDKHPPPTLVIEIVLLEEALRRSRESDRGRVSA